MFLFVLIQRRLTIFIVSILAFYVFFESVAGAEELRKSDNTTASIKLNLPPSVELGVLLEIVSRQLDINIVYDDQVSRNHITVRSPGTIDRKALRILLNSILKSQSLTLVPIEPDGWYEVVPNAEMLKHSKSINKTTTDPVEGDEEHPAIITQVFALNHTTSDQAKQVVTPFLTKPGGNAMVLAEQRLLVITDLTSNISRLERLISLIDVQSVQYETRFVQLKHIESELLVSQIQKVVSSRRKLYGETGGRDPSIEFEIASESRLNRVSVIGTNVALEAVDQWIDLLDQPLDLETKVYQLSHVPPDKVEKLARELVGADQLDDRYKATVDRETGLMIVRAQSELHEQIKVLIERLDIPLPEAQSPVRFYKLSNAKATEVLATIRSLESGQGFAGIRLEGQSSESDTQSNRDEVSQSAHRPDRNDGDFFSDNVQNEHSTDSDRSAPINLGQNLVTLQAKTNSGRATVTADVNTNSIIVVAEPSIQRVYEQLISQLDRRRPQVLVEVTLVSIDTSDGYSLGVEIARETESGSGRVLTFSSFGLSDVETNPLTLSLSPGIGFNGAMINTDIADVIIRALKTDGRSRVISAPKILVNDNATGTIESIAEAPVSSLNASDTVATTSFAGFVEAGTTISVTPHINEGEHLSLEFSLSINAFTGEASDTLPPPRQTNSVSSEVTIPNGQTIIVGGLSRTDLSFSKQAVPAVGEVPFLEYLFSNRSENNTSTTLFAFIRPVILRDDQFAHLRFLSDRDMKEAGLSADLPTNEPIWIR